jgi:hypothetical protein
MATRKFYRIPTAHAARVGQFLAEWSMLELVLEDLIWLLAGIDPHVGRIFASRLDLRPKTEIMDALLKLKAAPGEVADAWAEVRKVIPGLQENRNWIAHGIWRAGLETKAAVLSHRKGKPGESFTGIKIFTLAELDQLVAQVEQCHERLRDVRKFLEPPPSPGKS